MPFRLPEFGEPLPVHASPETLELLARRRSSSSQGLGRPGPTPDQLKALLTMGARVPDHGKLFPWRFVVIEGEAKSQLVERLRALAPSQPDPEQATAKLLKLAAPPTTVMVVSKVTPGLKIPEWEQQLSAGAVCMTMLFAAQAMGFGCNWITDWYAYEPQAAPILGLGDGERVAGFIHIGTPAEAPLERPRPDVEALTSYWAG